MTSKDTQWPKTTAHRWATHPGALVVSLVCACIALALSLPDGATLVRCPTRVADSHLGWPLLTMIGPGIEHAYLGLAVVALLLAAPALCSRARPAAMHRAATVSCCVASVPLAVAIARFLITLLFLLQLRAP